MPEPGPGPQYGAPPPAWRSALDPDTLARGALAGLTATAPMSLVMLALHDRLPRHQRYPLPPAIITRRAAHRAGLGRQAGQGRGHAAATLLAHFGYGAATGALYAPAAAWLRLPPMLGGLGYGLLVWLVSYLALLPAVGLFGPATRQPGLRNWLMVAAHVVWGVALGALEARGRPRM